MISPEAYSYSDNIESKNLPAVAEDRSLEDQRVPLHSPQVWEYLSGGTQSTTGIVVNAEKALSNPALWKAINYVSNAVAKLDLAPVVQLPDGGTEPAFNLPSYRLLMRMPSPYCTPLTFIQTLTKNTMLHGNGYAEIYRTPQGDPYELRILEPEDTYPKVIDGQLIYFTLEDGQRRFIYPENMLHIKGLSPDGLEGYSVLKVLQESLGLSLALQKYGAVFFRNNASGGPTIIELPGTVKNPEALKQVTRDWEKLHKGLNNAHKIVFLEGGAKLIDRAQDNEKAQFLDSREFELLSIANITGCPPHKVGAKISSSYNSLESENKSFLSDISHWLCAWEQECWAKLLTEAEKSSGKYIFTFDRQQLERADRDTEARIWREDYLAGIVTLEEARRAKGLPAKAKGTFYFEQQPEPTPEPQIAQQEPQPQLPAPEPDSRLEKLVEATLGRLLERVHRSGTADRETHLHIVAEALTPLSTAAEVLADRFLETLEARLNKEQSLKQMRQALPQFTREVLCPKQN